MAEAQRDHAYTERSLAEPLAEVAGAPRRSAAEEARTLLAGTSVASLATLSDGAPWASLVQTGVLDDGGVVLCVSTLAEHGRNLLDDPRASVLVAAPDAAEDALARGRVTLAGIAHRPEGPARDAARAAYCARVPYAEGYVDFGDFALWVLEVQRVRWVGGYGRMASAEAADYAAARPDPVAPHAARAVAHLNDDHADALLEMVRALGGHPDATAATCMAADRLGLDLEAATPRGRAITRVGFAAPIDEPGGLRTATVELTRRSRELLA